MRSIRLRSSIVTLLAVLIVAIGASSIQASTQQDLGGIDLGLEVMDWNGGEVVADEALVQFLPGIGATQREAVHTSLGCELIENIAEGLDRIRLGGEDLDARLATYNAHPSVDYAEPHNVYRTLFTPNDSDWGLQWGPQNMNCPAAWDLYTGGNTIVAILDSSVDYTHSDLAAHYHYGRDYYNGDNDPYDFFDFIGHGTHCSGIAAAVTNNANGIAGVGFDCKFAFYQVGMVILISDAAVIQSINDVIAQGWHVISMSFGGSGSSASMENALNNAYNAGVVCIAAAGNDGTTAQLYPAAYDNVIAVASHNVNNQRSSFSTYGQWVSVSAPGENIYSTIYSLWGNYTYMDGTSMACPHEAGMANILYSFIGGSRTKANADLIRSTIETTSVPASWVEYGRVDLYAAMLALTGGHNADFSYYNGTDFNPFIFTSTNYPVLGTNWITEIDGGSVGATGLTFAVAYSAPFAFMTGIGELLVDVSSTWMMTHIAGGGSGISSHSILLPNDPVLAGVHAYTQGLLNNVGGSAMLTNAIDATLGN